MDTRAVSEGKSFITVRLSGVVTKATLLNAISENYAGIGARSALWDFLNADLSAFHVDDFHEVAAAAAESVLVSPATHRKVAYATTDVTAFVKLCRYANEAVIIGNRTEYAVFRSLDEAQRWLVAP